MPMTIENQRSGLVRLGLVQWSMRAYGSERELLEQVERCVVELAARGADFALLPELFAAPLMAATPGLSAADSIRRLAARIAHFPAEFARLAADHHINLVAGSLPELVDGVLHNVGYLCRRDGRVERYEKIHVTPDESEAWAFKGGNSLRCFDTDCGKVGVLICYDVEFPELARLLADEGMDILFVPFLTDARSGYDRVRHCARARAVENECYVAIAGSVGHLDNVPNLDDHYAQSAVFTPCDFDFPDHGVLVEAPPHDETILVADVDVRRLEVLRERGSVRNLRDRRLDVYEVRRLPEK